MRRRLQLRGPDLRTRRRRRGRRLGLILALLLAACSKAPAPTTTETAKPPTKHETAAVVDDPVAVARIAARAAVDRNDFEAALKLLDDAVGRASADADRTKLRCNRGAVLSRRAALPTTTTTVKLRDLRAARADCPGEPVLITALTNVLVGRARELSDASGDTRNERRALLEESLKLEATAAAAVDLARLCDELDDSACAVAAAEQAVKLAPDDARVIALRDRLARHNDVEGSFKSARHTHFVARFEGYGEERVAWGALDVLEQKWFSVGKALDLYPTDPVTVVIYTGDQYKQATATPDWSSGIFDGKIRIREGQLAAERGSLDDTLAHEYVHAALRNCVPGDLPIWFHEGLAQHFEAHRDVAADVVARVGKPPLQVLAGSFLGLSDGDARAAYAMSQLMVEALIDKRGIYGVQQLLSEMKQGRSFDEAMQRAFALTTSTLWSSL